MDLKSTLIGSVLLVLAFLLITKSSYDQQKRHATSYNETLEAKPETGKPSEAIEKRVPLGRLLILCFRLSLRLKSWRRKIKEMLL